MKCIVEGCGNNQQKNTNYKEGKKITFFSFPKEEDLIKEWLSFCKTNKPFNPKSFRVCSDHFNPEEIHGDLRREMGFGLHRTLKPGVIPSRCAPKKPKVAETNDETQRQENKKIVEMLMSQHSNSSLGQPVGNFEGLSDGVLSEILIEVEPAKLQTFIKNAENNTHLDIVDLDEETITLQREAAIAAITGQTQRRLEKIIKTIQKDMDEIKRENEKLKKAITKAESDRENLELKLKKIFTDGQIKKIKSGDKNQQWTDEEIAYALPLYTASGRSYNLLLEKKFPLPAIRTLQYWIRRKKEDSNATNPVVKKEEKFDKVVLTEEELSTDELSDSNL